MIRRESGGGEPLNKQGNMLLAFIVVALLLIAILVSGIPAPGMKPLEAKPVVTVTGEASSVLKADSAVIGMVFKTQAETTDGARALGLEKIVIVAEKLKDYIGKNEITVLSAEASIGRIPVEWRAVAWVRTVSAIAGTAALEELKSSEGVEVTYAGPSTLDPSTARDDAIDKAVADAKAKAQVAASEAGLKLKTARAVRVLEVTYPRPELYQWSLSEAKPRPVNVPPLQVKVVVSVDFDAQ